MLDSNEYIFGIAPPGKSSCRALLDAVLADPLANSLRIPRTIVDEVRGNLASEDFKTFMTFINALAIIDEDFEVPFETAWKYEAKGLKPGDAFIAGYTEWVGANFLVTENRRDFLHRAGEFPFKAVNAETYLKLIKWK